MSTSVYGVAVTGLAAAEIGLSTTSHNIANAHTAGYNRQTIVQKTQMADPTGSGFLGRGVDVATVARVYNQYMSQQVNSAHAQNSFYTELNQHIGAINNMMADPNVGFSPTLQSFFSGVQAVSANPSSIPARQSLMGNAQTMISNMQTLDTQFNLMNTQLNDNLTATVGKINSISAQIANLNVAILTAEGAAGGQPSNDLLDERDNLVTEMNKLVNANVIRQGDGTYNIFIGNGQSLVVGAQAFTLGTVFSNSDAGELTVAYQQFGNTAHIPDAQLTGGTLGALLQFRTQMLEATRNQIGLVAMNIAVNINQLSRQGQDLRGNNGGNFFQIPQERIDTQTFNTPSGLATFTAENLGETPYVASDYNISFDGTNYSITQLSDGKTSALFDTTQMHAGVTAFGIQFKMQTVGADFAAGQQIGVTFKPAASAVLPNSENKGDGKLQVAIADTSALSGDDYTFFVTTVGDATLVPPVPPTYTLNRSDGAASWTSNDLVNWTVSGTNIKVTQPDGLEFQQLAGAFQTGDQYLIQPTRQTVMQMGLAITEAAQIAAALPMTGSSDVVTVASNAVVGNKSAATISTLSSAVSGQGGVAALPVTIKFNDYLQAIPNGPDVDIVDARSQTVLATSVAYTPGVPIIYQGRTVAQPGANPGPGAITYNLLNSQTGAVIGNNLPYTSGNAITYNGWSVAVSGYPKPDDAFAVQPTTNSGNAKVSPGAVTSTSYQFYTLTGTANSAAATVAVTGNGPLQNGTKTMNSVIEFPFQVQFIDPGNGNPPTTFNIVNVMNGNVVAANQAINGQPNITYLGASVAVPSPLGALQPPVSLPLYQIFEDQGTAGSPAPGMALGKPQVFSGQPITVDGWTATITGTPESGESFQIEELAQGTATGIGTVANTMTQNNPAIRRPIEINFVTPTSYQIKDPTNGQILQLARPNNFVPGNQISYNGWTAQVTGVPAAGDSFLVSPNTGGVSDNRNAVAIGQLQTTKTMLGHTASYQSAYSQWVAQVGVMSNQVKVNQSTQAAMLQQITQQQQSMSGVNLDEEASNLIIYQQAYQASSKVIQVAQKAFEQILNIN
ncbi:flagellar hook-associated protein FlgK [Burkholderiaceae bacterium DAT-1]|nr:flagellar hook-associated protein FlgK [Burkholderiaceae bacterium DAT-1]